MGIQHKTLPFAAVQFHPESILTSPIHGMTILTNALSFLSNESSDEKERPVCPWTKPELVMKLTLRQLSENDISAGKFQLSDMTVPELRELKTSLGVKGTAKNKSSLIELLANCLVKA
ncbi:hypothetical protein QTG54_005247 [Skeletonema marinoi]|uniref:Glutamine amidotransferase domain-containing protein n=1 Tax=Skeletonema marinoi TaxID=267567 RepID=A0AAD8YDT4_9STRA|nr:hypothetical protein QTG54_005247 [Skeletonema marinoi]